ncbi:hypothetical protein BCV69DRAFT_188334 [Microstroma glucosiphilum]|uniref:Uncharacterized protein n=1 Tax=Pseudomicrostroma glucosiphilum TaxID=1684307 RepID=A0A316U9Q9_9BASI|nr:hypothetical protein BCV69DRAFT_188334 [Pseudomicrostroma glucosiphilum]PWN21143.1 hypothetical protein BCV69DRAFT_188334 [Pseudomicrostroma glucosiphilum]
MRARGNRDDQRQRLEYSILSLRCLLTRRSNQAVHHFHSSFIPKYIFQFERNEIQPSLFSALLADDPSYGICLVLSARHEGRVVDVYHVYAGHLDRPSFARLRRGRGGLLPRWGS